MKVKVRFLSFFLFLLAACSQNSNIFAKNPPYAVKAEMVTDSSSIYEVAGLDFSFLNKSDQAVKSLTLVFYMFDEDGNPPGLGSNNVELEIIACVDAKSLLEDCVSLDQFLYEIPDEPYQLDYLYVSRIVYEDGQVWSDPFGMYAVN